MDKEQLEKIKERQALYRKVPLIPLWFRFSRCPWQYKTSSGLLDIGGHPVGEKWGWSNSKLKGMGRFGGGWRWKLGLEKGGHILLLNWIWGSIRFEWGEDPAVREERIRKEWEETKRHLEEMKKAREATEPSRYTAPF